MHTYKKKPGDLTHDDKWLVGYYTMEVKYNAWPSLWSAEGGPAVVSVWQYLSEHDSEQSAIERVNYLNGGVRSVYDDR